MTLTGSASDSDGAITEVIWMQVTGHSVVLSDPTSTSPVFTVTSTTADNLSFTFTATDDDGTKAASTVHITVEGPLLSSDPCCEALSPPAPGSALTCLDLNAFSCIVFDDPFCQLTEWDQACADLYRQGFFGGLLGGSCPAAETCL